MRRARRLERRGFVPSPPPPVPALVDGGARQGHTAAADFAGLRRGRCPPRRGQPRPPVPAVGTTTAAAPAGGTSAPLHRPPPPVCCWCTCLSLLLPTSSPPLARCDAPTASRSSSRSAPRVHVGRCGPARSAGVVPRPIGGCWFARCRRRCRRRRCRRRCCRRRRPPVDRRPREPRPSALAGGDPAPAGGDYDGRVGAAKDRCLRAGHA